MTIDNATITKMGKFILGYEARRDRDGRLAVYSLPPDDGGGTYEVAGINDKYHPAEAAALAALIHAGNYAAAERRAGAYLLRYTEAVADWSDIPSIEFFLRDCAFNRGPRGAATILQIAIGAEVDGRVGPATRAALDKADDDPVDLLAGLREAREIYERSTYTWKPQARNESSSLWKGLVNRWNNAARDAASFAVEKAVWREADDAPLPAAVAAVAAKSAWPRQSGVPAFYGSVGEHQTSLTLPFPMKIAWDKSKTITRFSIHEKVHDSAKACFERIADAYTEAQRTEIGIDLFGGCLNVRKMRGGNSFSMHSWGIAIDFDPERNQLKWGRDRARLAQPDCETFWRIWEDAGWLSLGRARNYDWMHVQAALL
jgi:lysozyme family protein